MNPNLRRWMALVVVCFGQLMIMLDTTIVNVALPYIQRDLRFSQADLTWVVNAYLIAFGGFLLLAGRIDRKSTRLNSSHVRISYAVFCLKKKTKETYALASTCVSTL